MCDDRARNVEIIPFILKFNQTKVEPQFDFLQELDTPFLHVKNSSWKNFEFYKQVTAHSNCNNLLTRHFAGGLSPLPSSRQFISQLVNTPAETSRIVTLNRLIWTVRLTACDEYADETSTANIQIPLVFQLTLCHGTLKAYVLRQWLLTLTTYLKDTEFTMSLFQVSYLPLSRDSSTLVHAIRFSMLSWSWNFISFLVHTPAKTRSPTLQLLISSIRFAFWEESTDCFEDGARGGQRLCVFTDTVWGCN